MNRSFVTNARGKRPRQKVLVGASIVRKNTNLERMRESVWFRLCVGGNRTEHDRSD